MSAIICNFQNFWTVRNNLFSPQTKFIGLREMREPCMQRPFFKNQPKTNNIDTMRNKKMYDRKCIYYCLLNNVSVETAATVIEMVVKEMTDWRLRTEPSKCGYNQSYGL